MRTLLAARSLRDAGFSLVELLAVLAIMSLMVGAVVLNLPGRTDPLERESQLIVDGVQAELSRAALEGEMRAVRLDREALHLLSGEEAVRVFAWPDSARISAREGETRLDLSADTPPLYWIEPYGAVPDVRVRLSGRQADYTLRFDARGRFVRETGFMRETGR